MVQLFQRSKYNYFKSKWCYRIPWLSPQNDTLEPICKWIDFYCWAVTGSTQQTKNLIKNWNEKFYCRLSPCLTDVLRVYIGIIIDFLYDTWRIFVMFV